MSAFSETREKYLEAQSFADGSKDEMNKIVYAVLEQYGITHVEIQSVDTCWNSDVATVTYGWSARGCWSDDTIDIPLSVLNAEDPVFAARTHQIRLKQEAAEAKRSELARKIASLTKELETT